MYNKSTLSISANRVSSCNKVENYLQLCGIPCKIYNKTTWNDNCNNKIKCFVVFKGRNEIVDNKLWFNLKKHFKLNCTNINNDKQFVGCMDN